MDIEKACERYAKDEGGEVVIGLTTEELDLWLPWTPHVWEDGVPVTKYFGRCEDEQHLIIPPGTKLHGITFTGRVSGSTIYSFYLNGMWYQLKHADTVLDSLEEV